MTTIHFGTLKLSDFFPISTLPSNYRLNSLSLHSEIIEFLGHKGEGEGFVDARGGSAAVRGTELLEMRAFSVLYLSVNNPSPSGVKL
jgi:hypothetical protein